VFEPPGKRWLIWLRALRLHQWMKNLLLFVPLFTAFAFNDGAKLLAALLAFFSFSLAASATYLFNDLWDLDNDRQHPRKKYRPFACAGNPLFHGLVMAGALLILAMALALSVSVSFASMVGGYILLTTAYSWTLKQYVLIDVLMLALLYTFRVLAGSVATDVNVTFWLLAFSIFTFFGLALVKRCAELLSLQQEGKQNSQGRDYQTGDMIVLWPLGIGASLCSVVIFGLYIASPGAAVQYNNTNALWLVGIGLLYWNARIWIKTARGEMHDDPVVFAVRDFGSRMTLLAMVALTISAHFLG
jgi:4-hydroxybenzoate polyprenyltransferase